ncbi:hypothetical protein LPB136_07100 [Tenacibaculum todarodis]|uniref:Uncharacterized protein n=1 Tax=Tenacibaculum todarodis TaxID=1850252 RepID=A0A1L3JJ09_9FLAO|nr:hypothetical protein [Tenacibaculum todarodis]APG65130.1 hypothetical protein LPB136_07100 [Tenacibaculum todarodis]
MKTSRMFYVVHAQFYVNLGVNGKRLKKITKFFNSAIPNESREEAIQFFTNIKNEYLIKSGADCVSYDEFFNQRSKDDVDFSLYDINFLGKANSNIALTLSFGVSDEAIYKEDIENSYYANVIKPICAVGASLNEIESELLINLYAEWHIYILLKYKTQEEITINNTVDKVFLRKYFAVNFLRTSSFIIKNVDVFNNGNFTSDYNVVNNITDLVKVENFKILPTPQFTKSESEKVSIEKSRNGCYIDYLKSNLKVKHDSELRNYKIELENLSSFFTVRLGRRIDVAKGLKLELTNLYGKNKEDYFFVSSQKEIHQKIVDNWHYHGFVIEWV